MINKINRFFIATIALALITIALSQIIVRALLPYADAQRARVEKELGTFLQAQVTIQAIDSHWHWLVPYLDFINIDITTPEHPDTRQRIARLSVGVNLWDMIRAAHLAPTTLQIDGLEINGVISDTGSLSFPGLMPSPQADKSKKDVPWHSLLQHKRIELGHGTLHLQNPSKKNSLDIEHIALKLEVKGKGFAGELNWHIASADPAKIKFDLQGDLKYPHTWQGQAAVALPPQPLAWLNALLPTDRFIQSGHLGLNTTIQFANGKITPTHSTIDIDLKTHTNRHINWSGAITADDNAEALQLTLPSPKLADTPKASLLTGIKVTLDSNRRFSPTLSIDYIDLAYLGTWMQALKIIPPGWQENRLKLAIKGTAKETRLTWSGSHGITASTQLALTRLNPLKPMPGIQNLSADLNYQDRQLKIAIDQNDMLLDTDGLFQAPLKLSHLKTTLTAGYDQEQLTLSTPSLSLSTSAGKAEGQLKLRLAKNTPLYLQANVQLKDFDIAQTPDYLPTGIMPETLVHWLNQALLSGRISTASGKIEGHIDTLLEPESESTFRIDADIIDADLRHLPDWPVTENIDAHVYFDKTTLGVDARKLNVWDTQITSAKAEIPNLRRAVLNLNLNAKNLPKKTVLRYIRESGLNQKTGAIADHLSVDHTIDLKFRLRQPLSKKISNPRTEFNATAILKNTELSLPLIDAKFTRLRGQIDFSDKAVNIKSVAGLLNNAPVTITADTQKSEHGRQAQLHIAGKFSPTVLLQQRLPLLTDNTKGETDWLATLSFPLEKEGSPAHLHIASSLTGLDIDLPEPLGKTAVERAPFEFDMTLTTAKANPLRLSYKNAMEGVLSFKKGLFYSGALNYKQGRPSLPETTGLTIYGAFERLHLDPWLKLINHSQTENNAKPEKQNPITQIQITANELLFQNQLVAQHALDIKQEPQEWVIDISGDTLLGQIALAKQNPKEAIKIKLSKFNFDGVTHTATETETTTSPNTIPPLDISIDHFTWGNINLQGLAAITQPQENGIHFQQFSISQPGFNLQGHGSWTQAQAGQQQTTLQITSKSDDYGKVMQSLGYPKLLKGGRGDINGSLSWQSPPWKFDTYSVSGKVTAHLKKGEFVSIEPGTAGRLLGLLSLNSLPKRLALDFKDVSSNGLAFNKFNAEASIKNGVIHIERSALSTDFGNITLTGTANLVENKINQTVIVTPDISNFIPVTAGIIGGVPGLLGAVVIERVIKLFGGNTDKIAEISYHLSGPINNPKMQKKSVRRIKDLSEEELRTNTETFIQEQKAKQSTETPKLPQDTDTSEQTKPHLDDNLQ